MRKNIAQRHSYILEQLKNDNYVKVQDLSEQLDVSEVTIRKDLKYLEEKRLLSRNYGYASNLPTIIPDRHIDVKEKIQVDEKIRIAQAAKDLIEPNDKIIIASGTTTLAFANIINELNIPLTVITPSIKVSLALCYNPNIEIIQLGGTMRKNAASVIGNEAEQMLSNVSCNKLFFGIDGLDIEYGMTTSSFSEAYIHQQMINSSREIIVLADSTKFGRRGFCKICNIDKVHHIVTDSNAPSNIIGMLRESEVEVTIASEN
jgi:DeoR family transcriptional regulator of aga operon